MKHFRSFGPSGAPHFGQSRSACFYRSGPAQWRMPGVESFEPYLSYALALFSGLLLGLEREHSRAQQGKHARFIGGVRTFPIFALIGALATSLAPALGVW